MAKVHLGFWAEEELIQRLQNAVWHLGRGLTFTSVTVEAIEDAVSRLERRNGGKPFPPRKPRRTSASVVANLSAPTSDGERGGGPAGRAQARQRQRADADSQR